MEMDTTHTEGTAQNTAGIVPNDPPRRGGDEPSLVAQAGNVGVVRESGRTIVTDVIDDDGQHYCDVIAGLLHLQQVVYTNSKEHGFYEGLVNSVIERCGKIALIHSELSEVVEAIRHGEPPSEKCPGFSNEEEELADCVIRIFDYAGWQGLRVAEAIVAKHRYNRTRPYMHGKKC